MSEYIDRKILLLELERFPHIALLAGSLIKSLPAADVVGVVRCKHCKFFEEGYCCRNDNNVTCEDYCSRGERKEQE